MTRRWEEGGKDREWVPRGSARVAHRLLPRKELRVRVDLRRHRDPPYAPTIHRRAASDAQHGEVKHHVRHRRREREGRGEGEKGANENMRFGIARVEAVIGDGPT